MPDRPLNLLSTARETLLRYGFLITPPPEAQVETEKLAEPDFSALTVKDLSAWLWSSIDNDDSRDLDQIEYLESDAQETRLYVAIADVAALVPQNSALDQAAWHNSTSLYTGIGNFPLFPEKLSTNLTSLIEGQKRLAMVTEIRFSPDGKMTVSTIYRAIVRNQAQLTYTAVAAWLAGEAGDGSSVTQRMLEKIRANASLQAQLRQQHALAQALRQRRLDAGALTFETIELQPRPLPNGQWELKAGAHNDATYLIEDFMIATNQATVLFLQSKNFPSLRRVVRTPKNWPRIVQLAAQSGAALPAEPDVKALEEFLLKARQKDPEHFPDLSLSVIKLLGRGEYIVAGAQGGAPGHFALAVEGYSHSTAPNRRYPDVITQRLLRAAIGGEPIPYSMEELAALAQHCTLKEDNANKAERSIRKSLAAAAMAHQIGQTFEGFITGSSDKGVWVRLTKPPVEGRVDGAVAGLAVGDHVSVKLISTDPQRGYIDFTLSQKSR